MALLPGLSLALKELLLYAFRQGPPAPLLLALQIRKLAADDGGSLIRPALHLLDLPGKFCGRPCFTGGLFFAFFDGFPLGE